MAIFNCYVSSPEGNSCRIPFGQANDISDSSMFYGWWMGQTSGADSKEFQTPSLGRFFHHSSGRFFLPLGYLTRLWTIAHLWMINMMICLLNSVIFFATSDHQRAMPKSEMNVKKSILGWSPYHFYTFLVTSTSEVTTISPMSSRTPSNNCKLKFIIQCQTKPSKPW